VSIAAAYAGIANKGKYCSPVAIDKVVRTDGTELPVPRTSCKQVVDPGVADAAVYAMRGVFQGGTASGDNTPDGLYEFGKTGTTDNAYDTWMTGSTSKVATSVWVGNNGTKRGGSLQNLRLTSFAATPCYTSGNGTAAVARHCVWKAVQTALNKDYGGAKGWADPLPQYLSGATPSVTGVVPATTRMSAEQAAQTLTAAGYASSIGASVPSDLPEGQVVSTTPQAGAVAAPGTQVVITTSSGTG
jgi:membrane peptidoglycan carboxypeptidase